MSTPLLNSDIPDEWIASFREAASKHNGVPYRASPTSPTIEVWSINRTAWLTQMLPGGGTAFDGVAERDLVMGRIG